MPDGEQLVADLLGPLHMHFRAAREIYEHYLENGRQFAAAAALRKINRSACGLLLQKGYLLPEPLRGDAVNLIAHYEVWMALWDDLQQRLRPTPSDPFVFENSFIYPRDAEDRLEALRRELCGEP